MTWQQAPPALRTLARWTTYVLVVGYTVSVAFAYHTTRLVPSGAASRYRGTDPALAQSARVPLQFPKPIGEMLLSTHTHLLTMALIFAVTGACFALCRWPKDERWKRFLIAEPFAAILVSFGAMWLMRFVDARFSYLLFASSTLMAATFYLQAGVVLWELRGSERARGEGPVNPA